jgi:hypothetical protein
MFMSMKLRKYFHGQTISVITKSIRGTQEVDGSLITGNHIIEGVYLDEDKTFLFLADSEGSVLDAVVKKDIVRVFINNPLAEHSFSSEEYN